jgi:putative acetyltransferase
MMQVAMDWAKSVGYTHAYLETMPELKKAVAVYEALGYKYLNGPLGDSGHHGCDIWMLKEL